MFATHQRLMARLAVGTILIWTACEAPAQCSRGGAGGSRGGAGATAPTGGFSSIARGPRTMANFSFAGTQRCYPNPQLSAMQNQLYQAQQQMLAIRQQMSRQQAEQRYANRQSMLSTRLARAERTREKRAERIALAKAKREAERDMRAGESSPEMYASKSKATQLTSLASNIDPFMW